MTILDKVQRLVDTYEVTEKLRSKTRSASMAETLEIAKTITANEGQMKALVIDLAATFATDFHRIADAMEAIQASIEKK